MLLQLVDAARTPPAGWRSAARNGFRAELTCATLSRLDRRVLRPVRAKHSRAPPLDHMASRFFVFLMLSSIFAGPVPASDRPRTRTATGARADPAAPPRHHHREARSSVRTPALGAAHRVKAGPSSADDPLVSSPRCFVVQVSRCPTAPCRRRCNASGGRPVNPPSISTT